MKWKALGKRKLAGNRGVFDMFRMTARVSGLSESRIVGADAAPLAVPLPVDALVSVLPMAVAAATERPRYCDSMATSSCRARYMDSRYCTRIWYSARRCDRLCSLVISVQSGYLWYYEFR